MNTNETIGIADLEAPQAGEVKGGPRLVITKAGITDEEGLPDLEPNNDVVGGAGGGPVRSGLGYAVLTVGGQTTVRSGASLQIQGGITVAGEGLGL